MKTEFLNKMKIKYITEGYFKNKADMQVQRAKERELTNQEKVANTYSSALVGKVQSIIQKIVYDKRINPVVASLFYVNGDYDADGKTTYERRDISCKIDYNGENPIIHVNFTLGRIIPTRIPRNEKPCSEVFMYGEHDYPQILNRLNKTNISANFSKTIKKEIGQAIKICDSSQRAWYEFILNSNIVIDDINMYTNATDIQELVIKFGYYAFRYNYYGETKEQFEEKVLSVYKDLAERLTSTIHFGIPVKFIIPIRNVLLGNTENDKFNNDFAISADYVSFADIFGKDYKNLGEIEDAIGKNNTLARLILYISTSNGGFSISKYLETSVEEESPLKQQIDELVRKCDHVWITYRQQFICECIDGKFTLVQKGKLLVGSIAFVIGQNMPSSPIRIIMSTLNYGRFTEKNPNDASISLQVDTRYPDIKISNTTFRKSTEVHKTMLAIKIFIEKLLRNKLK